MSTIDKLPRAIVRDAIKALESFALKRSARRESDSTNVVRLRPKPRAETVDRVATAQPIALEKEPLAK